MSKLPYLVAEISAALEVYLSGRTGQQYNRTAFILCDDGAELASKLFLLTDTPTWSDKGGGRFKTFKDVTGEVRAVFLAKRAADHAAVDALLKRIEGRRPVSEIRPECCYFRTCGLPRQAAPYHGYIKWLFRLWV